jgi:hypothetical protein
MQNFFVFIDQIHANNLVVRRIEENRRDALGPTTVAIFVQLIILTAATQVASRSIVAELPAIWWPQTTLVNI